MSKAPSLEPRLPYQGGPNIHLIGLKENLLPLWLTKAELMIKYFLYKTLPFGLSLNPIIFHSNARYRLPSVERYQCHR